MSREKKTNDSSCLPHGGVLTKDVKDIVENSIVKKRHPDWIDLDVFIYVVKMEKENTVCLFLFKLNQISSSSSDGNHHQQNSHS